MYVHASERASARASFPDTFGTHAGGHERRTVITGVGKSSGSVITSVGFPGGPGCNLSVGTGQKRTGRDYLGRWMQDANNDEGRRTNDVRLLVHSSHSVDRMFPSVSEIRPLYKIAPGAVAPRAGERPLV